LTIRRASVAAGGLLVVVAFAAATRVADTREGLIAEVVTLLSGLGGVSLLIFGLATRPGATTAPKTRRPAGFYRPRTRKDLLMGAAGIALAVVLVAGLAFSGGPLWAGLGLVLLLPMIAGCIYLVARFLRANP
jgi:hypothetical protein